ncbi:STE protein kinase [Fonticula alba]|uniref:mitogen-activated protein kinase kinase n=1 Tax=Fonticula alba TaxID=691883 RepID=A0A058ZH10_FONAL|nr:STE protein kinase [Fonticula alba]KCV72772.1 STE protein kinase [Fonticula alba]|eukprot:XP_009492473.1 STE protein kinase [Fonticula alba]
MHYYAPLTSAAGDQPLTLQLKCRFLHQWRRFRIDVPPASTERTCLNPVTSFVLPYPWKSHRQTLFCLDGCVNGECPAYGVLAETFLILVGSVHDNFGDVFILYENEEMPSIQVDGFPPCAFLSDPLDLAYALGKADSTTLKLILLPIDEDPPLAEDPAAPGPLADELAPREAGFQHPLHSAGESLDDSYSTGDPPCEDYPPQPWSPHASQEIPNTGDNGWDGLPQEVSGSMPAPRPPALAFGHEEDHFAERDPGARGNFPALAPAIPRISLPDDFLATGAGMQVIDPPFGPPRPRLPSLSLGPLPGADPDVEADSDALLAARYEGLSLGGDRPTTGSPAPPAATCVFCRNPLQAGVPSLCMDGTACIPDDPTFRVPAAMPDPGPSDPGLAGYPGPGALAPAGKPPGLTLLPPVPGLSVDVDSLPSVGNWDYLANIAAYMRDASLSMEDLEFVDIRSLCPGQLVAMTPCAGERPPPPATPDDMWPKAPPALPPTGGQSFSMLQGSLIGSGISSIVRLVRHKATGNLMALKVVTCPTDRSGGQSQIETELMILSQAKSPFIIGHFHNFFHRDGAIYIATEFMDCGSLHDVCHHPTLAREKPGIYPLPGGENALRHVARSTASALDYLHTQLGVLHRDIKPSNILLNIRGEVKVADLGVSARLNPDASGARTWIGTSVYMAPECIAHSKSYGPTADIWSLGITLIELAHGVHPFSTTSSSGILALINRVVYGPSPSLDAPQHLPRIEDPFYQPTFIRKLDDFHRPIDGSDLFSPQFSDFVQSCLHKDSKRRLPASALLLHGFITSLDDAAQRFCPAEWASSLYLATMKRELCSAHSAPAGPDRSTSPVPSPLDPPGNAATVPALSPGSSVDGALPE